MKKNEGKFIVVDPETGESFVKPEIWNQLTAKFRKKDHEVNSDPSMTVPGQTMTIAEMVARHRKGLPIDKSSGALYQGDELIPDISKMDLVDRQAYMDSVADALVEVKARIQESVKTKKEQEILDKIDSAVRERLATMRGQSKAIEDIGEEK